MNKLAHTSFLIKEGTIYTNDIIFLLCIRSNTNVCKIKLKKDKEFVSYPKDTFVQGAIYPFNISEINKLGGAEFIGYGLN